MTTHKTNLGVRPLGGKSSMGESAIVIAETATLRDLSNQIAELGPINSNEKAQLLRSILINNHKAMAAIMPRRANGSGLEQAFKDLGLAF